MTTILITGAYSTGKTTFVQALSTALIAQGIETLVLSDPGRESILPLNREQSDVSTIWLLSAQISKERTALDLVKPSVIVICDRGIPDILAHELDTRSRGRGLAQPSVLKVAQAWCQSYTMTFASSIDRDVPIQPDGIRVMDEDYRVALEGYSRQTLSLVPQVIELPKSLYDRLIVAMPHILDVVR